MAFSAAFLEELRARVGLADVIGRRVRLIKKGREHSGLCPFHKEKTPSFTVNEEKGFYHCFGCGAHGSAIDFVMQTEGLSFPETVERLAAHAGMEVPRSDPETRERERERDSLHAALDAACAWYERSLRLPEGSRALEYLKSRGLDDSTIGRFRLGFAHDARGALKGELIRQGFAEEKLIAAGLLIRPDDDNKTTYDRFRGRVMFPIMDRRGRVIAFGGRVLGNGEPKYLNSPETALFHKGANLYGLSQALPAIRETGTVAVAEGYMDVIQLAHGGIGFAVAPLGTALTEDQIALLWRLAREPILCFDGDAAGQRAAARAAERALPLLKSGYGLRFALLPAGEDPDSLVRRSGAVAMRRVLDAAEPLSETLWRIETGGRPPATPEARAALEERLKAHSVRIADPTVRSHFLAAFKDRLWREAREVRQQAATGVRGRARTGRWQTPASPGVPGVSAAQAAAAPADATLQVERLLIAIVANHPQLFPEFEDAFGAAQFADAGLDRLRQALVTALSGAQSPGDPRAALTALGHGEALADVLGHPLIRSHRLIRPGAVADDVRATWEEALDRLVAARTAVEVPRTAREALTGNLNEETWRRQQAILMAVGTDPGKDR